MCVADRHTEKLFPGSFDHRSYAKKDTVKRNLLKLIFVVKKR